MRKFLLVTFISFLFLFGLFFLVETTKAQIYDMWDSEAMQVFEFALSNPAVGDINKDGVAGASDILLLNRLMEDIHLYDVNGDNKVDNDDITYLVNFVYSAGPAPVIATRCRAIRVERNCDMYSTGNWEDTPETVRETPSKPKTIQSYPASPLMQYYDQTPATKDTTTAKNCKEKCCAKP